MARTTIKEILSQLQTVADSLSEDTVKVCAEKIDAHGRVFVYGAGRSGLMLRALAMRLMQMGKCAYVVGETVTPSVEEGDLLILASASGKTHSVCHYAEVAKHCGVDLLIITAAEQSPLTAIAPADVRFSVPDKDSAAGGVCPKALCGQVKTPSLLPVRRISARLLPTVCAKSDW